MTNVIDGNAVAAEVRAGLEDGVATLKDAGVTPTLATVLMNDKQASATYVSMKQRDCEELGMGTEDVRIDSDAPAEELFDTVEELNAREDVHGILVQDPTPDHVDEERVLGRRPAQGRRRLPPENVGKLVGGNPGSNPARPTASRSSSRARASTRRGRTSSSSAARRSSASHSPTSLSRRRRAPTPQSRSVTAGTEDLAAHTRRADIVVSAVGVEDLIDGPMLSDGCVVIDVGINRVDADNEKGTGSPATSTSRAPGEKASAITPSPAASAP